MVITGMFIIKKTKSSGIGTKKDQTSLILKINCYFFPVKNLLEKKKPPKKAIIKVPTTSKDKLIKNLIHGSVRLPPSKLTRKGLQTPLADSFLGFSSKSPKQKKKEKLKIEQKKKVWIFGNKFMQDCYGNKKDCGFAIDEEVNRYELKKSPQRKPIDFSKFPIDF